MNRTIIFAIVISFAFLFSDNLRAQDIERLFNGSDLSNWSFVLQDTDIPAQEVFSVRDGVIHITGPLGYMYTKQKYGNCHLHAEWRWPNGIESNSGIFLLIEDPANPFPNGIECQLKAKNAGDFVLLNGSSLEEYEDPVAEERPKFPVMGRESKSEEKKAGEWNEVNIYCYNGVITVYINGVFQNKGTNKVKEGYIGLQSEGTDVQFRNVTLTPLP